MTEFLSSLKSVIDLVFGLLTSVLNMIPQYPLLTFMFCAVVASAAIGTVIHLKRGIS